MKRKNDDRPACITVTSYGPDSLGTRYVQLHVAVREHDSPQDYPSTPRDAVAGVPMAARGMLVWRFYRASTHANYRGETDPPRELVASMGEPNYSDLHLVDAYDVKQIAATLATVERRLSKQHDRYGSTNDFAEYAMRVAACFEAEYIAVDWNLYTHVTGVKPRDFNRGERWRWIELSSARRFFQDLARVDTTDRCYKCHCPISVEGLASEGVENPHECHDCRRERERHEAKAREASSETIPAPEPREEDGVPVH